jgi:single-strand DNA-binding protein
MVHASSDGRVQPDRLKETSMSAIPITLTGTIATEPTARTLPSGRACASFRLAVNHWRVNRESGEFIDDGTSWFSVDCYGDLASNSSMSLQPGTAVIVTGSLKIRAWETAERSGLAPTVVAEHIGPDLRYGTANYRRAKNPDRAQGQGKQVAGDSGGSQNDPWNELGEPPTTAQEDAGTGDDETMTADQAPETGEQTPEAGEQTATETGEDPIARETAAAAAPF